MEGERLIARRSSQRSTTLLNLGAEHHATGGRDHPPLLGKIGAAASLGQETSFRHVFPETSHLDAVRVLGRSGGADASPPDDAYLSRLTAWLRIFSSWIKAGSDAAALVSARPRAPARAQNTDRDAWCRTLDADLGLALAALNLEPEPPMERRTR